MTAAKRLILHWCLVVAVREMLRTPRVSAETKAGVVVLSGVLVSPLVVSVVGASLIWWLLTGKRLPGLLGRLIGPPALIFVNAYPRQLRRLPPDIRAAFEKAEAS